MDAASLLFLIAACGVIGLYVILMIALVCWFADRWPITSRQPQQPAYHIRLFDRLRRSGLVRFADKKYALYAADYAAARFLERLSRHRLLNLDHDANGLRLMDYRADFVRVLEDRPVAGLARCLLYGNSEAQRLALWLLGKCDQQGVIPLLMRHGAHESVAVRKEVARGLRRLKAWAELRLLAEKETDPLVLRYTVQPPPKPFRSRLEQFLGHAVKEV